MLEASLCIAGGIRAEDTGFSEQTLDAAHEEFPKGIGLQELLLEAAQVNGFTGASFRSDMGGALQAAFSTQSLSGILSNAANKFLLNGFNSVEDSWRKIAAIKIAKDFKTVTSYRMSGGLEYEKVGPAGELKHGTVSEDSYTNQVETYGKMHSITRTDVVNDDMDAFATMPFRIGRGGHLKLNSVFWTTLLANAGNFFHADNNNHAAGADTALDIDSLTAAELMFLTQTDPDSNPIAVNPKTLLVPPALKTTAKVLMNSVELRNPGATKDVGISNPHAGSFEVVHSAYLSNSAITGNSALAWYLLADKNDLPVIEVAFLDPAQSPTVESAQADFNTLGIQFRGYFDFGVALQEYRGGVKIKGEV